MNVRRPCNPPESIDTDLFAAQSSEKNDWDL